MATMRKVELLRALAQPAAFPRPTAKVEVIQTHISMLFLTDDRVYKVKKPVDLGFLDFRSLADRKRFCELEVQLNREVTPGIHLGVLPVTLDEELGARIGGDGEVIDWAVEMVRLPAHFMLDRQLDAGVVDNARIDELAKLLVGFHGRCVTGKDVDDFGSRRVVEENVADNFAVLERLVHERVEHGRGVLSAKLLAFLRADAERFLQGPGDLFELRIEEGRIRDAHGDLHAGNICFAPEGISIYDRIEFSERFRCCDVASDLAFLAMDLDHRGYRAFSRYLVRRYAMLSSDPSLVRMVEFYKAYRAVVRGKVLGLTAQDESIGPEKREAARQSAASYLQLAATYGLSPQIVCVCGPDERERERVATAIARPREAFVFRASVLARQLEALPAEDELELRVDRELSHRAVRALEMGHSVVVDGPFSRPALRSAFRDATARTGFPTTFVWVGDDRAQPPAPDEPGVIRPGDDEPLVDLAGRVLDAALPESHDPR